MFCNYCRQVNPNDAVYCGACGREIGTALGRQKNSDPDGEQKSVIEVVPAPLVRTASSAKLNGPAPLDNFSIEELQEFTDEELDQLWRAYTRLQIPPSLAVQQEIKRRALLPRQLSPANSATPAPQSNQSDPGTVQLEAPQPPVFQPAPTDWMTLLNTEATPQPMKDKSSEAGADVALPPLPRTASVDAKGQVASPVGVLRDGKNIIVPRGARFPNFCIKCGEPARTSLQKTMYWHPSWLAILIFLGLLPYAIAVLAVRTKMDLTLPLCALHQKKYKTRRRLSLAILTASIGLLLSCFYLADDNIPMALGLGLVGLLTAGIVWELASTLLRANLIDGEKGSFRGANERFMQKCPQSPSVLGS